MTRKTLSAVLLCALLVSLIAPSLTWAQGPLGCQNLVGTEVTAAVAEDRSALDTPLVTFPGLTLLILQAGLLPTGPQTFGHSLLHHNPGYTSRILLNSYLL